MPLPPPPPRRRSISYATAEAAQLPALALPSAWPVCLCATGLLSAVLVRPEEVDQAGRLMYRLYGMYPAVLSAHMGAEVAARRDAGAGSSVFAIARRRPPDARRGYPWGQLGPGPHPPPLALRAGPPLGWPWGASFAMALLQWASRLRWLPGQGHVTYVEPALDFEAHTERALPAPSDHRLRGVALPLRTTGQVLKMALDALQPHLQARDLLQGKEVWMSESLLPLGGFRCVGRAVRVPGRHAVPNAPAGGALPRAMDVAPGAAGSGAAGCVPIGLPPPA